LNVLVSISIFSEASLHTVTEVGHALRHDVLCLFSLFHLKVFQQVRLNLTLLFLRFIPQHLGMTEVFNFKLLVLIRQIGVLVNLALIAIINDGRIVTDIIEVTVEHDIQRTEAHAHYTQE